MKSKKNGSEFYDNFITYQIKSGINDRIYHLYHRVKKLGIKSNARVLEIGCGIGSLTYLLSKKVSHGFYEAVDVSPKSIEYAKKHIPFSNVVFTATNILNYIPLHPPFDFVLLFDVLEHVPIEQQGLLFSKMSMWMNDQSILAINIPNPESIIYDQMHNPEALQEIDQPIYLDQLVSTIKNASLNLIYFETYSVWAKNDYQFFICKKQSPFREITLAETRNFSEKFIARLRRAWKDIRHTYPE